MKCETYAFDPTMTKVRHELYMKKSRSSLIEALYGPKHLNVSTSSSNKVDNDTSTGMARCNSGSNTIGKTHEIKSKENVVHRTDVHTPRQPSADLRG